MKSSTALSCFLLLTTLSGCFNEIRDEFAECKIACKNKWAAKMAYYEMGDVSCGISCPHSFQDGFIAGFVSIANGGNGCLPAVPMIECCNHMWMDFFCDDNSKMESWYDGYEHGVIAAKGYGLADSNRIITRSPQLTPADYTMPGTSSLNQPVTPIDSTSPIELPSPTPANDQEEMEPAIGGPQTSR